MHLPLLRVSGLATVLISNAAGCCLPSLGHGDATVSTCLPLIRREGDRIADVKLPRINISRAGEHRFMVHGLPDTEYHWEFWLPLPRPKWGQEHSWPPEGLEPAWAPAVVRLSVLTPDGATVAEHTCTLGDSIRNRAWPSDGVWKMSLADLRGWLRMRSYVLVVTVLTPSLQRRDSARVRALGYYNVSGN